MKLPTNTFWKFPHWSKLDQLHEFRHSHIISDALWDEMTQIEQIDRRRFVLYGKEQALLVVVDKRLGLLTLLFNLHQLLEKD